MKNYYLNKWYLISIKKKDKVFKLIREKSSEINCDNLFYKFIKNKKKVISNKKEKIFIIINAILNNKTWKILISIVGKNNNLEKLYKNKINIIDKKKKK